MAGLGHCGVCTWNRRPIEGNGPRPCTLMFLGEGPARDEIRRGYPFAGRSGAEFDEQYLPLAGLNRPQVFVSNTTKCPMPGLRNPTKAEALTCARAHLPTELAAVQPQIIVTLGAVAASVFDTLHTPGSLGREIDLELDHGIPTRASFGNWTGWLIPTYHPAAALRASRFAIPIREDFSDLPVHMRDIERTGGPAVWLDEFPDPLYEEILDPPYLSRILATYDPHQDGPAIDTESDGPRPWSLQFCLRPGEAYLLDAARPDLLRVFSTWLERTRPLVVLHNALHDLSTLLDMDPPIRVPRWIDTMMLAYHAQEFSQGLKPLAYRLCGMPMQDYDDMVVPPSLAAVESYAVDVISSLDRHFRYDHTLKSGVRKGSTEPRFRPEVSSEIRYVYARYSALLRDLHDPPEDFNPWTRIRDWQPEALAWAEAATGHPFPRKSIVHVPREDAIYYANRDADAALRILPRLRRRARAMGAGVLIGEGS